MVVTISTAAIDVAQRNGACSIRDHGSTHEQNRAIGQIDGYRYPAEAGLHTISGLPEIPSL